MEYLKRTLASAMLAFALSAAIVSGPLALTGCAAFNLQTPENFSERVVAAYKLVETAADVVGTTHAAGKITRAEANAALDKAQEMKAGIDAAASFRNAGDFSNAETRLQATIAALELLIAQLRAK